DASKGSLLSMLLQQSKDCFGAEVFHFESQESDNIIEHIPLQRIQHLPRVLSDISGNDGSPLSETTYGWAGVEAAPIGNAVHAILQQVAELGIEQWSDTHTTQANMDMQRLLLSEGLSGQILSNALHRCKIALSQTLTSKRGHWILSSKHQHSRCEWALSSMLGNQVSHVILDRSFIDEHATRWIIDYKTAAHEGGNIEQFLDEEQLRHAPQLEHYGRIIQTFEKQRTIQLALYFPMLDQWREWPLAQS
ncbi:MAG: PD-(D/E)XK nuclease family protein, partial [Mariprofundaceae bacterium]